MSVLLRPRLAPVGIMPQHQEDLLLERHQPGVKLPGAWRGEEGMEGGRAVHWAYEGGVVVVVTEFVTES